MANSPAMLSGYLALNAALDIGSLGGQLREQIALVVAEANGCNYCLAAHTALGKAAGLNRAEIASARRGAAADPRQTAALELAAALVEGNGRGADLELSRARAAGFTNGQIAEIVAEVALNILTNTFNTLVHTEIDFPAAEPLAAAA